MTYEQYSDHIKLCQYLGKEPEGEFKEFYDFITELWKDMEFTVINEYNDQGIIFHKGTVYYMEQDYKNGKLWCNWDRVWVFLRDTKGMEVLEIQDFIQSMVEQHLKCKALTPFLSLRVLCLSVEEHLKCKILTPVRTSDFPSRRVEEHLKCKILTPNMTQGIRKTPGGRTSQMQDTNTPDAGAQNHQGVEEHLKCETPANFSHHPSILSENHVYLCPDTTNMKPILIDIKPVSMADSGNCERCGTMCLKERVVMVAVNQEGEMYQDITENWGKCCASQYCHRSKKPSAVKQVKNDITQYQQYQKHIEETLLKRIATGNLVTYKVTRTTGSGFSFQEDETITCDSIKGAANTLYNMSGLPRKGFFFHGKPKWTHRPRLY